MSSWIEQIEKVKANWHTKTGLVSALILAIGFGLWVLSQIDAITLVQVITAITIAAAVTAGWGFSNRVERVKAGKVGIIVALRSDSDKQYKQIEADFIHHLRETMLSTEQQFVVLPRHVSAKVIDVESARRIVARCKGHFLIYGTARERQLKKKPHHVLRLEGYVTHNPAPTIVSKLFSVEFRELFPRERDIDAENDMVGFEVTAEIVAIVATYIMGVASLLFSQNYDYCESLFLRVKAMLSRFSEQPPAAKKIADRLPQRLRDVYVLKATQSHEQWKRSRHSPADLVRVKVDCEKLRTVSPNHYQLKLIDAIVVFVERRDIAAAIQRIRQCKGEEDPTWRYCYGFLLAYQGDLQQARVQYERAAERKSAQHVPVETEDFTQWILDLEPDRKQLHYCLALVNYYAKGDMQRALEELTTFCSAYPDKDCPKKFKPAKKHAHHLIAELRKHMADAQQRDLE